MIYYDSIDLDKSSEKINAQTLRLYNKEADHRIKIIKKQKRDAAKSKSNNKLKHKNHAIQTLRRNVKLQQMQTNIYNQKPGSMYFKLNWL